MNQPKAHSGVYDLENRVEIKNLCGESAENSDFLPNKLL